MTSLGLLFEYQRKPKFCTAFAQQLKMGVNLTFLVALDETKTIVLESRTIVGVRKLPDDGSGW
jgi:hypothetical protein